MVNPTTPPVPSSILGLPHGTTPLTGNEVMPVVQNDQTVQVPVSSVLTTPVQDYAQFYPGVPANGALLAAIVMIRSVSFPAGMAGSLAVSQEAATASAVLTLKKNGSSIGTITWAASGTSGTFSVASPTNLVAGDVISVTNQATSDTTLADISVSLKGTRSN